LPKEVRASNDSTVHGCVHRRGERSKLRGGGAGLGTARARRARPVRLAGVQVERRQAGERAEVRHAVLAFGRIVASQIEAPNMLANLVKGGWVVVRSDSATQPYPVRVERPASGALLDGV
jgi:hypothetical protein